MRREEGVNTPWRTDKINIRIEYGRAQRSGHHAGHVDEGHASGSVDHLQGQTDQQLYHQVEAQMQPTAN